MRGNLIRRKFEALSIVEYNEKRENESKRSQSIFSEACVFVNIASLFLLD